MDMHSSLGPDDFGLPFYKVVWSQIKPQLLELCSSFWADDINLNGLNQAHMVLLPKKWWCPLSLWVQAHFTSKPPHEVFSKTTVLPLLILIKLVSSMGATSLKTLSMLHASWAAVTSTKLPLLIWNWTSERRSIPFLGIAWIGSLRAEGLMIDGVYGFLTS